ncbi:hypothetical protein [Streptomyces sp. NBC_00078]|uniref:hypothetical protein n=1 Tax=unclassified Streptomyces TaxID=2593676 RepID=UPI002259E6D7|nr:hypothetical protein [Streptomyces sp. NBC_00078]MCX5425943.1 hypothetical protein [Streptomyces sp. NBC_00078]
MTFSDAAPKGEKGAVLRRERLYDSHVKEWRAARDAGVLGALADRRTTVCVRSGRRRPPRSSGSSGRSPGWRRRWRSGTPRWTCWEKGSSSWTALRERGLKDLFEPHLAELVEELKDHVGIGAACRLTGRSRAIHHRFRCSRSSTRFTCG